MLPERGRESDAYGFPLNVTPEQQVVLKRCRATSQRRAARDWARDAATAERKGALRRRFRASKKKSCRKVCRMATALLTCLQPSAVHSCHACV